MACTLIVANLLLKPIIISHNSHTKKQTSIKKKMIEIRLFLMESQLNLSSIVSPPFCPRCWTFQWRHNERNSVSNHQHLECLLNRLFRRRWMNYESPVSLAFGRGIHRWPVDSPHKGPLRGKRLMTFDDVIMNEPVTLRKWCARIMREQSPREIIQVLRRTMAMLGTWKRYH